MSEPVDFIEPDEFDPDDVERAERDLKKLDEADEQQIKDMLYKRKQMYGEVFSKGHTSQEAIDFVLNDLAWFCRAFTPSFNPNDGPHAETLAKMKDGRREAYMRIRDNASLSLDTLYLKYSDALSK